MIKTIIEYNNAKLELMGYFSKVYGLTHQLSRVQNEREQLFPAVYCGNGEFDPVSDFDFKYGLAYWRKTGDIDYSPASSNLVATKRMVTITIPVKLVVSIPREKLSNDDAYSSDRIVRSISKVLNDNNQSLKSALQARKIEINVTKSNDDINDVFREEFPGSELNYDLKYTLISIDLNFIIEANQECLEDECVGSYYQSTCFVLNRLVSAQNRRDCILPQFNFVTDEDFDALSPKQITDLTDQLCEGFGPYTYDVYFDGVDTGEDVTVDGTNITINLN